jgi:hypothetical protein
MPMHQQGVAASMLNTAINWSISLGLGIAGTIESNTVRKGNTLEGYRHALYAGIGLSGLGIFVALVFCRVPKTIHSDNEEQRRTDSSSITASNTAINDGVLNDEKLEEDFPKV